MKLTKPLLLLSAIALATASSTALADQSTEQVMGGNHQLPAILCITLTVTGTTVNLTRKADLKSVFFFITPSKF